MLKNTHKLRLQIDNPNGFITHCMSELSEEGVRQTTELNKDAKSKASILQLFSPQEADFIEVKGTKGTFLFRGHYDVITQAAYTLDGHAYSFSLLNSEHGEAMINHVFVLEQLLRLMLSATPDYAKIKKRMQVPDDRWDAKEAVTGMLWGHVTETYYTFIEVNEKGIKIHLCETEINPHNSESPIHVIVPANEQEIREYGINVQRFVDELPKRPDERTMRIL